MCQDCIDAANLTWDVADTLDKLADCTALCRLEKDKYRHQAEALRQLGSNIDEYAGACDPKKLKVK